MRWLAIIALLTSAAHAGPSKQELASALAKGDIESLRAAATFPIRVTSVWFDKASCLKFVGDWQVPESELAELVRCVVELQPRANGEVVLYGVGTPLWIELDASGHVTGLFSIYNTAHVDQRDAVPVEGKLFETRIGKLVDELKPPTKDRARIDASRTLRASAMVRLCVDKTGKVDSALVQDVSPDLPTYGEHIERATRTWTVKPFQLRGVPVRACGTFFVGYPDDRFGKAELARKGKAPAPTSPPPSVTPPRVMVPSEPPSATPPDATPPSATPQNVAPAALEALRMRGTTAIVPDAATKKQIAASWKDRIVSSWKLCVSTTGAVTSVTMLKSSGFAAYDTTIQAAITRWAYKPFEVNGKAVAVCTAQTIIYKP